MKIFKFMMVALVAMVGLNSCSKDCDHNFIEVDYSNKLAGTWTCVDAENEFAEALIFNADGSVTSTGVFEGGYWEKKGTYQIKGNQMTLSFEDGDYMKNRFEMVEGEVFSLVDDELDVHFNYNYCEKDLSDEIVGMWVSTQETFGQKNGSVAINTFNENGKAYVTAFVPEIDSYINQGESDYKVIGNMLITWVKYDPNLPELYTAIEINIIPNGTELGDIMTSYNPVYGTTVSFLRVKQSLNLTGKKYDYISAYVSNAKGKDEDFTIGESTFNMSNIKGGDFDMMFRAVLSCFEFSANSFTYKFRSNDMDIEFATPITVDGNKVTLDMSTTNSARRKVDMYMFQDANDSQLHIYMPTKSFINYFANLQIPTLKAEGELDTTDAAAVEKVFADMEARIESINVSLIYKARK
jgi:hypothetical protein